MKLFTVGLDFKTASLELRAKAFSKDAEFAEILAPDCREKIILSTCNRSEIFGIASAENADLPEAIIDQWLQTSKLQKEERSAFRIYRDQECLSHLFRITAGMESMVVGETQIHGQVKRAYDDGIRLGNVGPQFHKIFQSAFKVAKKIRARTEVGRLAVSIPSIGVKLAEKVLGNLSSKVVGIIGLGEIGTIAAEYFGSIQPKKLFLYNRTKAVAEALHSRLEKEGVHSEVVDSPDSILKEADVIISAVDVLLVKSEDLLKRDREGLPLFVLDLSVPPSVERGTFENIFLYGIDDLQKVARENTSLREQEVTKAEEIIQAEAEKCWHGLRTSSISETFESLAQKVEKLTTEELRELRARLPSISEKEWAEIEKMAFRLTSKVVQDPMMELKSQIQVSGESESLIQFFRNIFRI
ncbi:MAG: glutamyl-tRNA reductase [Bacteriovoracaceae bacterium]|nr:glutamyl-tRNA reductase [Bacteriovoracaceae bacterium]